MQYMYVQAMPEVTRRGETCLFWVYQLSLLRDAAMKGGMKTEMWALRGNDA